MVCSSPCCPEKEIKSSWYCFEDSDGEFHLQSLVCCIEEPLNILITGAQEGHVQNFINGQYLVQQQDVCDGFIRYKHQSKPSWLEYNQSRSSWHIKPTTSKGTTNAWYCSLLDHIMTSPSSYY